MVASFLLRNGPNGLLFKGEKEEDMLKRFIIFLIRKRLGLKEWEEFQFHNQKNKDEWYYFSYNAVWKKYHSRFNLEGGWYFRQSDVSLNWLLDDRCKIIKKEV